ncbi:TonB-dependent receptor domain-containing protein [Pseudomonadota bacterium]
MNNREITTPASLLQILLLTLILAFTASSVWADDDQTDSNDTDTTDQQDATDDVGVDVDDEDDSAELDRVVVTGSRLQRETYTSISPLQIITAQGSREAGLVNAAEILQKSTASAGQQIDLSFTGFVLDNGPGASTVDLRGLGAGRTLVLLNGRRLAPSGVEGVPVAPDLNLIPGLMVQQYDILLDGASSIYGSDAVAGVTNILMRKDFDGLELDVFYNQPDHSNGESYDINAVYGMNFDRGNFGIGVEYYKAKEIKVKDRPWTGQCDKNHEIDQSGNIRSQEQFYPTVYGMEWDDCRLGSLAARTFMPLRSGSVYYTPGYTNGGWPNFSESSSDGFGVDGNGDGMTDLTFRDYDLNGKPSDYNRSLWPKSDRLSVMAYGEYVFEGEMNNTIYTELSYNKRNFKANGGEGQLFPDVPANNPYNLCNPNAVGGVDCGEAQDALYTNPNFVDQFSTEYESLCAGFDIPKEFCTPATFGLLTGPVGPIYTQPIVSVTGDRNLVKTSMNQFRGVLGLRGDLPGIDWGSMAGWQYDLAFVYTQSKGKSHRYGVRGDRLDLSLGAFSSTNTPCNNDLGVELASDTAAGCVPVNMYAPSLYPVGVVTGDFATQAERDYLFDSRDFDTKYTQSLFSAYANGFLFEMEGGTAMGGIGVEWRKDKIDSDPDEVARDGLFFGFFSDGGATGDKWTREIFAEMELPILAGRKFAEELTFNGSVRYTDDEFYGSGTTYSAKLGWRPVNSLFLRVTYGTSFRAPNLREVFLQDQTGFNNLLDPCVVPEGAFNPITGDYVPELDQRDPVVLENCFLTGVDPTALDNNGFNVYSTEIARGGTTDLKAETSQSFTTGFAFEQPWWDSFDMTFGVTYYSINIDDTIVEPTAQFLINDCYNDPNFDSAFCNNIERAPDGFFDIINARYINRDNAKNRGWDYNFNYDQNFNWGSRAVRLGVDLVVNQNVEASTTFLDDDGNPDFEDSHANLYYPKWKANLGLRANVDDFRFTWVINYIGKTEQEEAFVDDWSDISGSADTCFGPPDDTFCRDFADTDDYWLHSASVYWYGDTWTVGAGIRNVFDKRPPYVDGTEYVAINRVPIGGAYDLFGRVYFLNVSWRPGNF